MDEQLFKQLIATFKAELDEKLLVITNGLLELEKKDPANKDFNKIFAEIFRAAHNIKSAARAVGAMDVGEIAHHVETLFSSLQKGIVNISPEIINLCLHAVDAMREAMQCYSDNRPLTFDLNVLLTALQECSQFTISGELQPAIKPIAETVSTALMPAKTSEYESIRISLHHLDRVSVGMEEMQVNKIAIEDYYADMLKLDFKMQHFMQTLGRNDAHFDSLFEVGKAIHQLRKELHNRVNEAAVLFNIMQDQIRMLRLVPVATQFNHLPRIVRDLAYELKKSIQLEINDNEVKIDKMVLDGLKDPIIHILRNAIDHGIESAEVRKANGKPEQGNIQIDVSQEGGHILFTIKDDGAGIDKSKIIATALKRNIATQAQLNSMSQQDIDALLFRAGFSTKETATDISGRGVGLDVVRANLDKLKGLVHFVTELGKGTTFFLRVPLTLATEHGLIVKSGGQLFIITTSSVEQVMLLKPNDILEVEGSQAILMKKQPVLLAALSDVLDVQQKKLSKKEQLSIVVIKNDRASVALLVDEIVGEREIVLKPLQAPLANAPYMIGATLLGSNQVVFVLNSSTIINKAMQLSPPARHPVT